MIIMIKPTDEGCGVILDNYNICEIKTTPLDIIEELCLCYGSTISGRRKAMEQAISVKQMVPILINDEATMFLIPTQSSKNANCVWINYYAISHFKSVNDHTKIYFSDGTIFEIEYSRRSLTKQIKRCEKYLRLLNQRKRLYHLDEWNKTHI